MQVCLACATETAASGRFCPSCGAVFAVDVRAETLDSAPVELPDAPPSPAGVSLAGLTIDGFAIEAVLGGGAFSTVYRARQIGLDRVVALKVPTHEIAADPVMARRFAREARAASRVTHPGVVGIHAVGELPDGRPYIAMQLVDGAPLDRMFVAHPRGIPPRRALAIVRQLASALSETHAADVIHRDLKPSNIMWRVDRNGDDRLTLVDFGIAVSRPGTADATRLTSGGLIGTPHYMSPEQAQGEHVDGRADLYALGVILFELVTGDTPFSGSGVEVLLAHLGRPAPAPSSRMRDLPSVIDDLVGALLAKRPEHRPDSADAVVALVDAALAELPRPRSSPRTQKLLGAITRGRRSARPPSHDDVLALDPAPAPAPAPPRRRRRDLALGAAGALVVVAGLAGTWWAIESRTPSHDAEPANGSGTPRREVFRDDGQTRLRAFVPSPMRVRASGHRVHLELRNKLGQPIAGGQVVVTLEAPDGKTSGLIARPRQSQPDQYSFYDRFAVPGTYRARVFPPATTSAFELDLVVEP